MACFARPLFPSPHLHHPLAITLSRLVVDTGPYHSYTKRVRNNFPYLALYTVPSVQIKNDLAKRSELALRHAHFSVGQHRLHGFTIQVIKLCDELSGDGRAL